MKSNAAASLEAAQPHFVYCTLAVLNETLRIRFRQTGDPRYEIVKGAVRALYWEHLLGFRCKGGLSGHAEMQGRTLFLKFNTGPSGHHGSPAAAGLAVALKRAGAGEVKVFILEGEGGLTPGCTHETLNSAWGLALDNLYFLVDWNDFGIDDHPSVGEEYALSSDWDDRWRTGGSLEEVMEEAHLSGQWIVKGIERFVRDRSRRLGRLRSALAE